MNRVTTSRRGILNMRRKIGSSPGSFAKTRA
jgi:hypothetical protein